jgi:hypothetical protein
VRIEVPDALYAGTREGGWQGGSTTIGLTMHIARPAHE